MWRRAETSFRNGTVDTLQKNPKPTKKYQNPPQNCLNARCLWLREHVDVKYKQDIPVDDSCLT